VTGLVENAAHTDGYTVTDNTVSDEEKPSEDPHRKLRATSSLTASFENWTRDSRTYCRDAAKIDKTRLATLTKPRRVAKAC
jgi:hypothetical protein